MLLEVRNITVNFNGLAAVSDLSLSVEGGEIVSLIGPNGAGKTTVFNVLSRFYTPVCGQYLFAEENMLNCPPHKVISKGIARSFQNVELFKKMTVEQNLLIGLHVKLGTGLFSGILRTPRFLRSERKALDKAHMILQAFGLTGLENRLVESLPFGQQKLVDIARGLISEPRLLLLDEPVAGMNPAETELFAATVQKIGKDLNLAILIIEHDMSMVTQVSDRLVVMNFGRKIADGVPLQIINNPSVIEAYLGEGG